MAQAQADEGSGLPHLRDVTRRFENRLTRIASFGRYAPAVGFFDVPGDSPYNPFDTADASYPKDDDGVPLPFSIFHRFVGHGPRDDDTERYELDNVIGLNGSLGDGAINYEAYARFYRYQASEEGETYILQSQVELEAELGEYDLTNPLSQDPNHLAALGRMAATLYRDILTEYTAAGATIDGPGPDLLAGPIGWATGMEVASSDYMDDYDSFREAEQRARLGRQQRGGQPQPLGRVRRGGDPGPR